MARTMGVMNFWKNPRISIRDGKHAWKKFMTRPAMCAPSWSESAMTITRPYRRPSALAYVRPVWRPRICLSAAISALFAMAATAASRQFSSLPRRGKTPYLSRPTTPSPAMARALAESPSVRTSVHSPLRLVPAQLASVSFATFTRPLLDPSVFLRFLSSSSDARTPASATTSSRSTPTAFFRNASDTAILALDVRNSLLCVSNVGLTAVALTKTNMWFLTMDGLTTTFFLAAASATALDTTSTTDATWVPPRPVHTEFTNDT